MTHIRWPSACETVRDAEGLARLDGMLHGPLEPRLILVVDVQAAVEALRFHHAAIEAAQPRQAVVVVQDAELVVAGELADAVGDGVEHAFQLVVLLIDELLEQLERFVVVGHTLSVLAGKSSISPPLNATGCRKFTRLV